MNLFFRRLEDQLTSERILDAAVALLLNRTRERFLEEVNPDGIPWEPSIAGFLRRGEGDTGTLFATGSLFNSIDAFRKAPGVRSIAVTDGARNRETGELVADYALIHQEGLEGEPKREFLGFSIADAVAVETLMVSLLRRVPKPRR